MKWDFGPAWRNCYCAFCKVQRSVYVKKHVGIKDIAYGIVMALLASVLFWQEIHFKFIPIAIVILGVSEVFIQVRWRLGISCQKCGFDPVLYLREPNKAAAKVKLRLEERRTNPNILDKSLPVLMNNKKPVGQLPANKI